MLLPSRFIVGDDPSAHRVIETIPMRRYRLSALVQLARVEPADESRQATRRSLTGRPWLFAGGLLLLGTVLLGVAW